jgi:hypothetical protein
MFLGLGRPAGDARLRLLMGWASVMFAYYPPSTPRFTTWSSVAARNGGGAVFAICVLGVAVRSAQPSSDYFTFQKASAAGAIEPLPFAVAMAGYLSGSEGLQPEALSHIARRVSRRTSCRSSPRCSRSSCLRRHALKDVQRLQAGWFKVRS